MIRRPPSSTLFPYTPLFRSRLPRRPALVAGAGLLVRQRVVDRRRGRLVVRRERPVHEARRHEQPALAVRPHDEGLRPGEGIEADAVRFGLRVRRLRRTEVRDVVAHPLSLGYRLLGLRIGRVHERRVPPDPALALAPGVALQVGRRAVVHDAAVGGPRPPPLQVRPRYAPRVPLPPRRPVLVPGPVAAAVDPRRPPRRPVVLSLAAAPPGLV